MTALFGLSWDDAKKPRRLLATLLSTLLIALLSAPAAAPIGAQTSDLVSVIVRAVPGAADDAVEAAKLLGGNVTQHLGIIDGFVAELPAGAVDELSHNPAVAAATPDGRVHLNSVEVEEQSGDPSSLHSIANEVIGAADFYADGYTGEGVDVAVIDSGVVPVDGLTTPGKVLHGPDLSTEALVCDDSGACEPGPARYLDTYGHGTHMAGIIAGRDDAVATVQPSDGANFLGVAPGSRIVSVKVADHTGATDVSQVIAAIDWVVQHRKSNGLNIRVLNLSFGTDSDQHYTLDPLAYAAEVAWHRGIVVVAAVGNHGDTLGRVTVPATDPYVIAVGAADTNGTYDVGDDTVPIWSARGPGGPLLSEADYALYRNPDVVAPGRSVISLRNPGSHADEEAPTARVGERFFRGSGTSQAAAVVSGAAALLLEQRPELTPDQVKMLLAQTARAIPSTERSAAGFGLVDLSQAKVAATPSYTQKWDRANGLGFIHKSRGSKRVKVDGEEITGEFDARKKGWNGSTWSGSTWSGSTWSGGAWNGSTWSGGAWNGSTWSGSTWSGSTWSGKYWTGSTWSGSTWSGSTWSGSTWSGVSWN